MRSTPAAADQSTHEDLLRLVYELLDAHDDTARLASDLAEADPAWQIHLSYLRDLQRVGRGMLAQAVADSDAAPDDLALDAARAAVRRAVAGLTIASTLELPR